MPALSHRNMLSLSLRQRFAEDEQNSYRSNESRRQSDSDDSQRSYQSYSTAPTDYGSFDPWSSNGHGDKYRELCTSHGTFGPLCEEPDCLGSLPRSSFDSVASTCSTISEPCEQSHDAAQLDYDVPLRPSDPCFFGPVPSTPSDFARLFPSTRRLTIAHDDSTPDGNMNLRIDTRVRLDSGRQQDVTLFHLRMHDLRSRAFSLRRYERNSGREVCHTRDRLSGSKTEKRPSLQRSLSSAIASLMSKSDIKEDAMDEWQDSGSRHGSVDSTSTMSAKPSDTIKLDFSNYSQTAVKRRGSGPNRRYEFEHWGTAYCWKRVVRKDDGNDRTSYHLLRAHSTTPLAHIVPLPLAPPEQRAESVKGGWIPPCSMWISDEDICHADNDISE